MNLERFDVRCMPQEVASAIRKCATNSVYPCGTPIFQQGRNSDAVFFIHSGLVKIVNVSPDGREVITALRPAGWLLGDDSAISNVPHGASAVTAMQCTLGSIGTSRFLDLLRTNTAISLYLHELQSREIMDHVRQEQALRTVSLRGRFARFLCRFLPTREKIQSTLPVWLEIPLKQQEVAQFLSVTPEHFSRVAKQMEREGLIQRHTQGVTVFRTEELLRSAQAL
jgi:CRP/FNR family transcriptional regulator, cyclic AMP receptor protein